MRSMNIKQSLIGMFGMDNKLIYYLKQELINNPIILTKPTKSCVPSWLLNTCG